MKLFVSCLIILLAACGEIPPSDDLVDAQRDFIDARDKPQTPIGACESDLSIMYAENHHFAERWSENSGISGLNESAMAQEFPTLTTACLSCLGKFTKCSVAQCGLGICDSFFGYGPKHLKCRECSHNACGAEMIKCSGLLPSQWPDFDRGQL